MHGMISGVSWVDSALDDNMTRGVCTRRLDVDSSIDNFQPETQRLLMVNGFLQKAQYCTVCAEVSNDASVKLSIFVCDF
jgi:hypothetical protein